jgi:hypothetical protein
MRLTLIVFAAALLSSCGATRINRILNDPTRWQNRTVRVDGTVTNAVGAFVVGGYQVEDGTGKIFVISNRGVPSKGSRVRVSGTVMNGINVLGRSYGTAIREEGRRVRD